MSLRITVFTATFNRAGTLPRVYESLVRQTLLPGDFEWLIVDDGSTDDTEALVRAWAEDAPFAIRYARVPHGGKHRAWNHALTLASGELFVSIDSDDACVPSSLQRFRETWIALDASRRRTLGGIIARCQTVDGDVIGGPFPAARVLSFSELVVRHRWTHDVWLAVRTDVLRAHPFPMGPDGQLVPEGTLLHALSRHHRFVLLDEPLLVYYVGVHGRDDQLSKTTAKPLEAQAPGLLLAHQSLLAHAFGLFLDRPLLFARSAVHVTRFAMHSGVPLPRAIGEIDDRRARALCWALAPLALGAYLRDRVRRS